MRTIAKIFEWVFSTRSRSLTTIFLKTLILWQPLLTLLMCFSFGSLEHIGPRMIQSWVIGTLVTSTCFLVIASVRGVSAWRASRAGVPVTARSRGWWFSLSLFTMPLGLYLGFKVASLLGPVLGFQGMLATGEDYRFGVFLGALIAAVLFLSRTRADAKEAARAAELKLKKIENEHLQSQLSALTAQMNPHLLFNALNTVAALVPEDPAQAERTIVKLSELYRGVLDASRHPLHSLATELQICEAYLGIEKARFGERVRVEIQLEPSLDGQVIDIPALCLQPLVENAVKHGLAPRASGGRIWITVRRVEEDLQITVEDDGVGVSTASVSGSGTGMRNCRERLKLHYGERGRMECAPRAGGGTKVCLTLPFRRDA